MAWTYASMGILTSLSMKAPTNVPYEMTKSALPIPVLKPVPTTVVPERQVARMLLV
jgi:hypothetical protein